MKNITSFLLFLVVLATSCIAAAPPVVVVTSLTQVSLNGIPAGTVVDVLANGGDAVRGPLLDALIAYDAARVIATNATAAATITAAHQADVASVASAQATAKSSADEATIAKAAQADAEKRAADLAAAVAKLALPPEDLKPLLDAATTTYNDKVKAQLQAQADAIAVELAKTK